MAATSVILKLAKDTQGTYVYQEDLSKPRTERTFPTIYVQKHALPSPPPKEIRVTVEAVPS